MDARELADVAIDEDLRAPCLWLPSDLFAEFCVLIRQQPNVAGVVIYRHKTVRDGGPYCDVTTRAP